MGGVALQGSIPFTDQRRLAKAGWGEDERQFTIQPCLLLPLSTFSRGIELVSLLENGLLGGRHAIGRYAQYQRLPPNDKVQRTALGAPSAEPIAS